jgi:hypothetical protein
LDADKRRLNRFFYFFSLNSNLAIESRSINGVRPYIKDTIKDSKLQVERGKEFSYINFNTFLYMFGLLSIVIVVLVGISVVFIMFRILEEIERRKNGNK